MGISQGHTHANNQCSLWKCENHGNQNSSQSLRDLPLNTRVNKVTTQAAWVSYKDTVAWGRSSGETNNLNGSNAYIQKTLFKIKIKIRKKKKKKPSKSWCDCSTSGWLCKTQLCRHGEVASPHIHATGSPSCSFGLSCVTNGIKKKSRLSCFA